MPVNVVFLLSRPILFVCSSHSSAMLGIPPATNPQKGNECKELLLIIFEPVIGLFGNNEGVHRLSLLWPGFHQPTLSFQFFVIKRSAKVVQLTECPFPSQLCHFRSVFLVLCYKSVSKNCSSGYSSKPSRFQFRSPKCRHLCKFSTVMFSANPFKESSSSSFSLAE
jgi:hypothetical protein